MSGSWLGWAGGVAVIGTALVASCSAENEPDDEPLRNRGGSALTSNAGSPNTSGGAGGRASSAGGSAGMGGAGVAGNDVGSNGGSTAAVDAGLEPDPADGVGFAEDVWPIFTSECGPCHTTQEREDVRVGSADVDRAFADAVRLGNRLISRIDGGGMPLGCEGDPGDPGCLSVAQVETIRAWAAAGRPRNRP